MISIRSRYVTGLSMVMSVFSLSRNYMQVTIVFGNFECMFCFLYNFYYMLLCMCCVKA